jgi:hypothetical protein
MDVTEDMAASCPPKFGMTRPTSDPIWRFFPKSRGKASPQGVQVSYPQLDHRKRLAREVAPPTLDLTAKNTTKTAMPSHRGVL